MSARILVHPRCSMYPAADALCHTLERHGLDTTRILQFKAPGSRAYELVRLVAEEGMKQLFERFDGTRFVHRMGEISPEPEVA